MIGLNIPNTIAKIPAFAGKTPLLSYHVIPDEAKRNSGIFLFAAFLGLAYT